MTQKDKTSRAAKKNTLIQYEKEVKDGEEGKDDSKSVVAYKDIIVGEIPVEGYIYIKK